MAKLLRHSNATNVTNTNGNHAIIYYTSNIVQNDGALQEIMEWGPSVRRVVQQALGRNIRRIEGPPRMDSE